MWFAASIIVNTMLMAGFLLVMLGLARVAYGTEEQKQKWLPDLTAGKALAAARIAESAHPLDEGRLEGLGRGPLPVQDPQLVHLARHRRRGGLPVVMGHPEEHDEAVARTSHLPHLLAALVAGLGGSPSWGALVHPADVTLH